MARGLGAAVVALLVLATLGGCRLVDRPSLGRSPLRPAKPSSDSIELEVYSAHFPHADREINGPLWNEVDEQRVPAETRRLLAQHGMRAGVVGSRPPDALTKLMRITDQPTDLDQEISAAELDNDPAVTLRLLPLNSGKRGEIVTSRAYDELPLITRQDGQVGGRAYANAECHLAVRAKHEADGRISIELTPELAHGDARTKFIGAEGVLRLESGRPRQIFDNLRIATQLAPGEMLLITALPEMSGGLGHYFFTEQGMSGLLQKMVVIRPARGRPSTLFAEEKDAGAKDVISE